jgi:hypothetical protein
LTRFHQKSSAVPPNSFAELEQLEALIEANHAHLTARQACWGDSGVRRFPVYAITMGSTDPNHPSIGFFGGVHGLERIGSVVVLAFLENLVARLAWDDALVQKLERVRVVFMPIVNPAGMWRGTRANGHGIDLMRNAPIDAVERVPLMVGGQRWSARLPWYRGAAGEPMQAESEALCQVVRQEMLGRRFSVALDCHSGFGTHDRIWFPYAYRTQAIEHLAEIQALKTIFDQSHPQHRYLFEPQSLQYLAHGDLWDYLYRDSLSTAHQVFLPLTLEMGSWRWVRKNPRQMFSRHGIFNPLITHREQRVIRRHMAWMDFLLRATSSFARWLPDEPARAGLVDQARKQWYPS